MLSNRGGADDADRRSRESQATTRVIQWDAESFLRAAEQEASFQFYVACWVLYARLEDMSKRSRYATVVIHPRGGCAERR